MEVGYLDRILVEFGTMVGFAAVVSFLVNVLKLIHWVKDGVVKYLIQDGTADKWIAGINLVGVVALYITRLVVPDFEIINVDTVLGEIALAGSYVLGFVSMLLGSKITYFASRGLPIIGTSRSSSSAVVLAISSNTGSEIANSPTGNETVEHDHAVENVGVVPNPSVITPPIIMPPEPQDVPRYPEPPE